jgi:catechol 2,3-dioxygenase-like lactoylglutathione lyase family enzyme
MIRPDMIGLVVEDIRRSLAFYRHLGLEVADPKGDEPYVEVKANGYRISWNSVQMVKKLEPGWAPPAGHRMELAFLCDSPKEVDATYETLAKAGYTGHKEPWDAFWGQRYAVVVDPDGNHVSIFAALPK